MTRNKVMRLGLLTAMSIIVVRLFFIQIIQHDKWAEKAAAQQTLQNVLPAKRGEIYMMDGNEPVAVVMNATVYTVIVDPMLANRESVEEKLGSLIKDKQIAKWDDVFANRTRRYYIVAKNVERKAAEQIADLDLTGVWLQSNTKRVYPEGELAANLLGFVNAEGIGQYGIEGALNDELTGEDGLLKTIKDINNVALSIGDDNVKIAAKDGENVVLTIDKTMQHNIEKILEKKSQEIGFKNLEAIVMDPNNGEVLAMANYPGYDPANFGNVESAAAYINHVVEDPFEPASVCKTFAFAAATDLGVMTPDKTFTNFGEITIDGWPIRNAEQGANLLGTQTMQTAFNYSLNTGSTQALRWMGGSETEITQTAREKLYEYYFNRFGLGHYTGIELYESPGYLVEPNADMYGLASTYANMTFGQNMQATMVQVAAAISSVVNGGKYYIPTIVAGKMVNGEFIANEEREPVRQTISAQTSASMREMLYNTRKMWRSNGTDPVGYYVGGKTGTAQVIKDGAYSMDETQATYVGVGGKEGELPSYVIMVRVWEEGKLAGGQEHALPVFNDLKNYVQNYLRIQPKTAE